MTIPLLTTKFHVPTLRPNLVARPHLLQRLHAALHHKLTLISAPAGFGKTTLITQWLHSADRPFTWLSLDEGDNDPSRFAAYLIAALQEIDDRIGQGVKSQPGTPELRPRVEPLTTALINDIALASVPFVLVLDDYHAIHLQWIHRVLEFLLTHAPPQMHLVLGTRSDPPLPLPLLRARGQITEIRASDLRFTAGEAAAFLNQELGLTLDAGHVDALEARTEGWIAGLQLAALSMRNRTDVTGFVSDFSGSNRHVVDYLAEEVIEHQPDDRHDFLCQTAILDRLTAPLCDSVTGRQDSQPLLRQLERDNLFLIPLDDRRKWYRYHGLFAEVLRNHLQEDHVEEMPQLHRRAARWYEHNGFAAEAIGHTLAAGDWAWAARLIEKAVERTFSRGEITTFLDWVEALPDREVRAKPSLSVFHAWALLLTGRPLDTVEYRLQDIDTADVPTSGRVAALRALIAAFRAQFSRVTELCQQALDQLPEDDVFLRSVVVLNSAIPTMWAGDVMPASRVWANVARVGREAANVPVTVIAMCQDAEQHMLAGQLQEAAEIYQHALEVASDRKGRRLPLAGMALIGLGELSREWDRLDRAAEDVTEGIDTIRQWLEAGAIDGYITLARVKQAQGDPTGALNSIEEAQQIARRFDASELDDLFVAVHQVRLHIAQGNVKAATHCAAECGLDASILTSGPDPENPQDGRLASSYHLRELAGIALARLRVAQQQPTGVLELLAALQREAETRQRIGSVIEIMVLRALILQARGDISPAMACLGHALSLAEPAGYIRIFVDEGPPMADLLRRAATSGIVATHGVARQYIDRLLATFTGPKGVSEGAHIEVAFPPRQTLPPIESLSEREHEVLRLLRTALSAPEIAAQLYISVNTVRSHVKRIYGKLDVHSRMEAIQRAEELGLL
jgi:LuxR family maltose regulon positive regulatory protein